MNGYPDFPLARKDERLGLLQGILAGTVGKGKIKKALKADQAARPHQKACVAGGNWFPSVIAAARYEYSMTKRRASADDHHRRLGALQKKIARWCEADDREGYYWDNPA